jgi:IS30 family transposase
VAAIEYFTRWVEAKPVVNITSTSVKCFVWQTIICRFGIPWEITVDNCRQFASEEFKDFCKTLRIQIDFALVYHPQSNRAVEKANGLIFRAIKKCLLNQAHGKWAEALSQVI